MIRRLPVPARRELMTAEVRGHGVRCAEAAYPPGLRIGVHAHERASITIVADGGIEERGARGRVRACGRGVLIARPAGAAHADDIGGGGVVNLELELEPALLADHGVRAVTPAIRGGGAIDGLVRRLRRELRANEPARSLRVEGLALELIALALAAPAVPRSDAALARAHQRIHDEFRARLTIAALAAEAGLHPVSFARAFRARYRCSPGELVRRLRVEWAAQQLAAGDPRSIAAIAADAGFYDQSHFTRVFAAHTGRTPGAARRA